MLVPRVRESAFKLTGLSRIDSGLLGRRISSIVRNTAAAPRGFMRISETGSRLVVRDTPHGLWSLGMVFVLTGAFVLSTPFWSVDWRSFGPWERLAMIAIGLGHLAGG